MKKLFIVFGVCFILSGCSRAFWASDWDKAETERMQASLLERQTIAIEKIVQILEENTTCKN
jgi:hypothetical protein